MASPSPSRASHRSTDPPDPAPPDISEAPPSPSSPPPSPVSPSSAPVAFLSPSASSFDAIAHQLQKSSIPPEIPAAALFHYAGVESEADVNGELNGPVMSNGDMKQVVSEDVTRTDMEPPMLRPDILLDSNEEIPLSNGDSKISEHLDCEEDLSNQSSGEEVPWQTKLSKKAKRIQEKGNQWQTPAGSVSKALRFGFRVQGSSLGKKPKL
ncbi:unnamed protein product [Brassica napus]|uniref:(rape) hypothetical protein n=1 Tax=Brassica napus TaxID=3708 RepID=A0A816K136_BRANA|nr:unnamed protein product [Brassica napus]